MQREWRARGAIEQELHELQLLNAEFAEAGAQRTQRKHRTGKAGAAQRLQQEGLSTKASSRAKTEFLGNCTASSDSNSRACSGLCSRS